MSAHAAHDDPTTALDPDQRQRLVAFRDVLLRWNLRFNLTAIDDPVAVDRRLIGDALRMLPALDAALAEAPPPMQRERLGRGPLANRLIDVGTGAGFPGIVLKIARPGLGVTLIEATGKKVSFLEHAIGELGLVGIVALHTRAEELAHDAEHRERYDVATARAVAALPALLELCMPFVRVGAYGLFPKGANIAGELAMAERAAGMLGARLLGSAQLPADADDPVTRLVEAVKIGTTPGRYPRRSGLPAKEPLGRIGT